MKTRFLWRAHRARFRDQAAELSVIRRYTRPDDLVCDIGANKGSYMYWMSRWAGQVVAFEPQSGLADYLARACHALKLDNVTIERAGVSSRSGTMDLYVPSPNSPEASLVRHGDARTVPVSVVTLDEYFTASNRVSLLKIDVEGAEMDVMKGAERILRQDRPALVFECEQRHLRQGSVHDCLTYLTDLGYQCQFVDRGQLKPIEDFNLATHQSDVGDHFWTADAYCNNFVFRCRD